MDAFIKFTKFPFQDLQNSGVIKQMTHFVKHKNSFESKIAYQIIFYSEYYSKTAYFNFKGYVVPYVATTSNRRVKSPNLYDFHDLDDCTHSKLDEQHQSFHVKQSN